MLSPTLGVPLLITGQPERTDQKVFNRKKFLRMSVTSKYVDYLGNFRKVE